MNKISIMYWLILFTVIHVTDEWFQFWMQIQILFISTNLFLKKNWIREQKQNLEKFISHITIDFFHLQLAKDINPFCHNFNCDNIAYSVWYPPKPSFRAIHFWKENKAKTLSGIKQACHTTEQLHSKTVENVSINKIIPKALVYNSIFDFCWSTLFAIKLSSYRKEARLKRVHIRMEYCKHWFNVEKLKQ